MIRILPLAALAPFLVAAAPAKTPAKPTAPTPATKAYCKKMYAGAYALCRYGDRDCRFLAADRWARCEATGRWPS